MREIDLFNIVKLTHVPDLQKSEKQYSRYDCYSEKYKMDIELKCRNKHYDELMIEMKKRVEDYRSTNAALKEVSKSQHRVRLALNEAGFLCVVCYGSKEALLTIHAYMNSQEVPLSILTRWDEYDWEKLAKD